MQNTLFVLLDGMEDDPNPALDGKKPYEVANMPFIRSIAPHMCWTTGRGYTHLFLNEFWTGRPLGIARAAIEARGLGMNMARGRIAFRMSPAYIQNGMVHWAYGADDKADGLEQSMRDHMHLLEEGDPDVRFFVRGRSVITMECDGPIPDGPQAPTDGPYVPVGGRLQEFMMAIAAENDGLTVYPWGIGGAGRMRPAFPQIGNMTAISNSPAALGIATSLGHRIELVPDLGDRFPAARRALRDGNVFLHMDEVDECGHERDHNRKVKVLEHIDALMSEYFQDTERLVFFVDHGTSCVTGTHILMDVPLRTSLNCFKDGQHVALKDIVPAVLEAKE